MFLLCDEMLRGLGRWLRAAGHDTVIAGAGAEDRDLVARAARDGRALLTRDRHLASFDTGPACVVLIAANALDAQARELRDRLGLDWLAAPFTRCMVDNAALVLAGPHHRARVPEFSRVIGDDLRRCQECGRLYWAGGHVRRMRARLEVWAAKDP